MVEFVSVLLVVVITTILLVVRVLYVISQSNKRIPNTSQKQLSTLIVLGSGGHTAEMINLLSVMHKDRFAPRFYIAAATDNMSLLKARAFEDTLDDKGPKAAEFLQTYRSREVGQSYITSVGTTLFALGHALWLMIKIRPRVILCNGPGTCVPICAIAFIFKVFGIRWSYIFYMESIARVKRLSLSGLLLYKLRMVDQLFVQWPQLQKQYPRAYYCAKDAVKITKDKNGVDLVTLQNPRGFTAQVSLHGGQVLSWKNERGEELLFRSSKAKSKPPAAVRAGIPICFPQFGNRGSLEQHGFARNRIWEIDYNPPPLHRYECDGKAFIDLLLKPSEEDMRIWPHSFEFRLRVLLTCDGALKLISRVRNIGCKAFSFSIAYHTYFLVSDISEVRVEGLETLDYLDNLHQKERFTEQGDALTFETEVRFLDIGTSQVLLYYRTTLQKVDRVYVGSPHMLGVFDHEKRRTFLIRKVGLPDAVVWNPWEKKARAIQDMGDEEYRQTICVDGAAVEKPIKLKPGEEWTGRLELSALPSL